MKVKPPPPAQRILLAHMNETGVLLPEDPIRVQKQTLERMHAQGWIRFETHKDGSRSWFLTDAGRAVYPWPARQA